MPLVLKCQKGEQSFPAVDLGRRVQKIHRSGGQNLGWGSSFTGVCWPIGSPNQKELKIEPIRSGFWKQRNLRITAFRHPKQQYQNCRPEKTKTVTRISYKFENCF